MIVQDSFNTDQQMLDEYNQSENWSDQFQADTMWTPGWWAKEPENIWERTLQKIWEPLITDTSPVKGFEYWLNVIHVSDHMQWHFDKDEVKYERDGTVVSPAIGSVYYPVPHLVKGGYLEIQDEVHEIERIAPVYNRMIVFQSNHLHRVTPVYAGPRFVFVSNVWTETVPEAFSDKSEEA